MTTIPQLSQAMQTLLRDKAEELGWSSGFVQRRSKLGGAALIQTLVFGWLAKPDASWHELTQTSAVLGIDITPQGLEQRLGQRAATFLRTVLEQAVAIAVRAEQLPVNLWEHFTEIRLQDSTTISLPAELAALWPGCGGGQAPGDGAAALKMQVQWELQRGQLVALELQPGRTSDRAATPWLCDFPAGALSLTDLGYFDLDRLAAQTAAGAYWFTRVQAGTRLVTATGDSYSLAGFLGTVTVKQVDGPIYLGASQRVPCRLLAMRVPPPVAEERRRKLHAEARCKGQTVSAERLALADWSIWATNVPSDWLTIEQAWPLARLRWQIELLFKLWKSYGQVDQSHSAKPGHILCEVYAKVLGQLIQHWVLVCCGWEFPDRSLFQAAQTIQKHAWAFAAALPQTAALVQVLETVRRCLTYGCRLNKRKQAPASFQLMAACGLLNA